jgi:pyrroloquinoline quinone biosynthesis protein E
MGGWGKGFMNITPAGKVLPCHAAETIKWLKFDNVQDRPLLDIWLNSDAFNAFRGTSWMKEPCRSCPRKAVDFGGCRCQAFALTGDAANTDPVCTLTPLRHIIDEALGEPAKTMDEFEYRYVTGEPAQV